MRSDNSNQKYVSVRNTATRSTAEIEIVHALTMYPRMRRNFEGGGAWYAETPRRAFFQPRGGIFDLGRLTGVGSDILGRFGVCGGPRLSQGGADR